MGKRRPGMAPKIGTFNLSQLTPSNYNPRIIDMTAMEGLCASIEKFGCVVPIVVNIRGKKNIIIGGHQRYKALVNLYGKDHRCSCVTVDLSKADEKALNITLNNPAVQGRFIDGLNEYVEKLRKELDNEELFLDLQLNQLRTELSIPEDGCTYREENIRPFKKTHVLISFPPHALPKIADHLEAIIRVDEVEYEQCSN